MSVAVAVKRWQDLAACRTNGGIGIDFFSEDPVDIARAKAVCARCSVRVECLAYAEGAGEEDGVWGGLSVQERRRSVTAHVSHVCLSCGGMLVPFDDKRELCLDCNCIWFAES